MENKVIPVFFAYNGENKDSIVNIYNGLKKSDCIEYSLNILYKGEIEKFESSSATFFDVSEYIKDSSSEFYKFAIPMEDKDE